jgi:hypothetical protein
MAAALHTPCPPPFKEGAMPRATRSIAVLVTVLIVLAGCRTVTGRSAGQWIDDKTTTAKVKAAVASAQIGSLSRVDVDTSNGTVFVTGVTSNDSERQRIADAARMAADGKPMTSNLVLVTAKRDEAAAAAAMSPAASARTHTEAATLQAGQMHLAGAGSPPATPLKFSRMEAEAPSYARFAAYDKAGKRVATVYTLPASELRTGLAGLHGGDRRIDHISIYPHPGSGEPQYHLVLWHVNRQQARALE